MNLAAGEFLVWLRGVGDDADVPCGDCNACCRASMFIHIEPGEARTLERIPRPLLFAAPGWPKGHVLMGYNQRGHCPMLAEGKCTVYEDRPRTCRRYDCRVFAATGIAVDAAQPAVADRVGKWQFTYESDESREAQRMVRAAAAFLVEKRDLFPTGSLPTHPAPLAAMAVWVHQLFDRERAAAELVSAILASE